MSTSTLNVPQVIAVLILTGVLLRYFFFQPSSSSSASNTFPGSSGVDMRHVEQIAQMFPQVGRRDIMWDLQRNGGSVAATSERILGRGLDVPPPSFQPPSLESNPSSPVGNQLFPSTPLPQNLITRYNLSSKLSQLTNSQEAPPNSDTAVLGAGKGKSTTWGASKTERQAILARRREEMIIGARRRLEEHINRNAERS